MKLLEERILKDGQIREGSILKVDAFLNHQLDIGLMQEIGKEFARIFADAGINKILTIEASGIAIASIAAQYFGNVPVVFAKKAKSKNLDGSLYTSVVHSYTYGKDFNVTLSQKFLGPQDNVLVIDDFLASGKAMKGILVRGSFGQAVTSNLANVFRHLLLGDNVEDALFRAGALLVFLFSLTGSRDGKGLITRRGFAAAALLVVFLLGSFFAATRTMSTYDHYINIMVPSFAILTALGLTLWRDEKLRGNCAFAMLAALTGVFCLKMVTIDKVQPIQALQQHEIIDEDVYPFSDVIHYLNSHVRPGEPVAVWGWETGFPIYATMPSATASHSSTSGSSTDCCATSLYATPTRASGWLLCSSTMTWRATRSAP